MVAFCYRRLSAPMGLVLLVAGMVLCLLFPATAGAQVGTGTIMGYVTAADTGLGLAAEVKVYNTFGEEVGTGIGPNYEVSELEPGSYKLRFIPTDLVHASIYYGDVYNFVEAEAVIVGDDQTIICNQACPLGGVIKGRLSDLASGDPLDPLKFEIQVYRVRMDFHDRIVELARPALGEGRIPLQPDGRYEVKGLEPGLYLVASMGITGGSTQGDGFHYNEWWYDGVAGQDKAKEITIDVEATVSGVDLEVPAGGRLQGTVTGTDGNPVSNCSVKAHVYDSTTKKYVLKAVGSSNVEGIYIVGPISPGTVKLEFEPNEDTPYVTCWYNTTDTVRKSTIDQADSFSLAALQTRIINGLVWTSATVSGQVVADDEHHGPIENVRVEVWLLVGQNYVHLSDKDAVTQGQFYFDPDQGWIYDPANWGYYQLERLEPGTYKLMFMPNRPWWKTEWYSNKKSMAEANTIVCGRDAHIRHIDAQLEWLKMPVNAATSSQYSDDQKTLMEQGIPYVELGSDPASSFDIFNPCLMAKFKRIFINCSSAFRDAYVAVADSGLWDLLDRDDSPLAQWVRAGGQLFLDDHSMSVLNREFQYPVMLTDRSETIPKQTVNSTVVDTGLQKALGSSTASVKYDLDGHSAVIGTSPSSVVLIKGNVRTDHGTTRYNSAMAMEIPYGQGRLECTNFHMSAQSQSFRTRMLNYLMGEVPPAPRITSLSAQSGSIGTTLVINGANFGASRGTSYVLFNTTKATSYPSWSQSRISVVIPKGATSGLVKAVTPQGTSNGISFTVTGGGSPATWYLAEGTCDWGFETYVTIENPNATRCTANITYYTADGDEKRDPINLPAMSQVTVNPRDDLGRPVDFSTRVVCSEGKPIAVDRRMIWTGPGAPSQEGHSSIGVTDSSKTWYFAEGSTDWDFECYLLVQNPQVSTANLTVTYMIEGEGPVQKSRSVPPKSRATWNMAEDIGQKDASVKIVSSQFVIAERAMYRYNRREGHESIGTAAPANNFYLAEGTTGYGFTTYILIQNPNSSATDVTVTYMTNEGPQVQPKLSLPANSRKTINVNDLAEMADKDFSTRVQGSRPIIAERAMYWTTAAGEACHGSIGMDAPHKKFYLPDGQTSDGYETWTLVQNSNNSAVSIEVTYFPENGDGGPRGFTDNVPANSRKTYNMADYVPDGKAAIYVGTKDGKKIMVERAMYWSSRGAGANTIGGFSDL